MANAINCSAEEGFKSRRRVEATGCGIAGRNAVKEEPEAHEASAVAHVVPT